MFDWLRELKGIYFSRWENYDPVWLVEDCAKKYGEYPWLKEALSHCIRAKVRSNFYTYFVESNNPNKPGSVWQIQDSIIVEDTREGDIILDIIKENRVGGVEFYSRLFND